MDDADRQQLRERGWFVHPLAHTEHLDALRARLASGLDRHETLVDEPDDRLRIVAELTADVAASGLVHDLLRANGEVFRELLGPDVDVQTAPHLRVVRPGREGDQVSWHRDSFYGAGAYEISCWVPLAELGAGAGLRVVRGSHRLPSTNLRPVDDPDEFRSSVTKGSTAHDLGFPYAPKGDDVSISANSRDSDLVTPALGSCVIFLSSMVHRGENRSAATRVSVDVRLHNPHTPTGVKVGYYTPLLRGVIAECAADFLGEARNS